MTKTNFAELKEKLTKIDYVAANAYLTRYMEGGYEEPTYQQYGDYIHGKSAAIISELIEIIKLQSVTIDSICTTHSDDCTDADEDFSEDETCECGYIAIVNNKKETTARLQKLRDGKNEHRK